MKKIIISIISVIFIFILAITNIISPLHYKVEYSGSSEIPKESYAVGDAYLKHVKKGSDSYSTDIYILQSTGNQSSRPWVYGLFYSSKEVTIYVTEPKEPEGIKLPAVDEHLLKVTVPKTIESVNVVKVKRIPPIEIGLHIAKIVKYILGFS